MKYKAEIETFTQYKALRETYNYLMEKSKKIKSFLEEQNFNSISFIGCGSSYSLAKSGGLSIKLRTDLASYAIAAGDLMINFPVYERILKNTLLITMSRSGSTSELIKAAKKCIKAYKTPIFSICASKNSKLAEISDFILETPWAFDESVCQTRTVSNFLLVTLMITGIFNNDQKLLNELNTWIDEGENFLQTAQNQLKIFSDQQIDIDENKKSWDSVVILADAELEGIADEGAIAFKEIPQVNSNYHHALDVRHGPMVLIGDKTLVILAISPYDQKYQKDLINDIKEKNALVITISSEVKNIWGADLNISIPKFTNNVVAGFPLINVIQILSLNKALQRDLNPDEPPGLNPWISL
jgi:fructoselysine-6-P-deglycase FrlB-like protein